VPRPVHATPCDGYSEGASDAAAAVVAGITERGYAVIRNALDPKDVASLRSHALALEAAGQLAPAGVGRGLARTERTDVRGDRIRWLDGTRPAPPEVAAHTLFEAVRLFCNRELALGLFELEAHYALYPPGSAYARHRDRFRDDDARVLSCVLYLNEGWRAEDGGALRIHFDHARCLDVVPHGGTLVAFLSDRFDHEVLAATRPRLALTGWFRRRAC
jgi:SM-20-related protein